MTIVSMTANYSWAGKRTGVTGTVATDVRHYATIDETRSQGNSAGVGASFRLPARTSLQFNEGFAYSPTYTYGLFPTGAPFIELGSTPPSAPDYKVTTLESFAYTTTVGVSHEITTRSRLSANGDFMYSDRLHETERWRDVTSHSINADYSQNISPNTALSVQYRFRNGAFGNAGEGETTEHGVNFATSYTKPLSATRRLDLDVSIGVSVADVPVLILGSDSLVPERQFLGNGQVNFGYDFGRSWHVAANYRRGIEYIIDLPQPVFADSLGASVVGMLNRRVDVVVFGGYSSGASLLNRNSLVVQHLHRQRACALCADEDVGDLRRIPVLLLLQFSRKRPANRGHPARCRAQWSACRAFAVATRIEKVRR